MGLHLVVVTLMMITTSLLPLVKMLPHIRTIAAGPLRHHIFVHLVFANQRSVAQLFAPQTPVACLVRTASTRQLAELTHGSSCGQTGTPLSSRLGPTIWSLTLWCMLPMPCLSEKKGDTMEGEFTKKVVFLSLFLFFCRA